MGVQFSKTACYRQWLPPSAVARLPILLPLKLVVGGGVEPPVFTTWVAVLQTALFGHLEKPYNKLVVLRGLEPPRYYDFPTAPQAAAYCQFRHRTIVKAASTSIVGVEPTSGDHHSGRIWMFRLGLHELERAPCQPAPDARRTCTKPTSTLQDSNPPLPHQSRGVLTTNTKGVVGCLKKRIPLLKPVASLSGPGNAFQTRLDLNQQQQQGNWYFHSELPRDMRLKRAWSSC